MNLLRRVSFWRPLQALLLGLAAVLVVHAQTNPAAQSLPFSLTSQSGSSLPVGVAAHKFAAIPITRTTAPGTADLAYNSGVTTGSWRDEAASGISLLASSATPAGALVVAIDTTGKTAIQVSWLCRTISQVASRDNSIALQYRVGTAGNFIDVGTTSTYTSAGKLAGDVSTTFTETLPAAAENLPVVQLRWIYWESAGTSGSRDRIAIDDISISGNSPTPTNPAAGASASPTAVQPGQGVLLTVTVTPGTNPASTGLSVTGDLTAIGGSPTQAFTAGAGNTFTYNATIPGNLSYGSKLLNFSVLDAQTRTATAALNLAVRGNLTIFHTNDTHARVTPHKWVIPQHSGGIRTPSLKTWAA